MESEFRDDHVEYVDRLLSSGEVEVLDMRTVRNLLLDAMDEAVRMRDDDFDPPKDW